MSLIDKLRRTNKGIEIFSIHDSIFSLYGEILDSRPYEELIKLIDKETIILDHNVYQSDVPAFHEEMAVCAASRYFGTKQIQFGYCNGVNKTMNGMEYHKSPEITVAVYDIMLFLALKNDLDDYVLDSREAKVFFAEKGSVFALYPSVLHLSPCCVHPSGFKAGIILPLGTNCELEGVEKGCSGEDRFLFKTNKWMLAHPQREALLAQGAVASLKGHNRELQPVEE